MGQCQGMSPAHTPSGHLLDDHDATGLAALVAAGDVSPAELVQASLDRIEERDPALNAIIHRRDDSVRSEAAALPDGPFRGVPMVIKDLWASTAGDPMHNGNRALKEAQFTTPDDSDLVALYRRAGFAFVGRTNTPELGLVATTEPTSHGPTRNPWNTNRGAGGSSGGSAAAVAAGMVPVGHASDGGGSIRIPASLCGLVGLKPSRGRVPMGPWSDEWGVSVHHVVTRSVRDSASILDVGSVMPPGSAMVAPRAGSLTTFAAAVDHDANAQRVVLLPEAVGADISTHPACVALVQHVGALLEGMGHGVSEGVPPTFGDESATGDFLALWSAGCAASVERMGAMIGRELTADDVEPGTWQMAEFGRTTRAPDLLRAQGAHVAIRRKLQTWFTDECDLLVTPTCASPAPPVGALASSEADPHAGSRGSIPFATFTAPFNVSGQPAISLPMGMTDDGLPIGVQIVAQWGREDLLFQIAGALERAEPWFDRRPELQTAAD